MSDTFEFNFGDSSTESTSHSSTCSTGAFEFDFGEDEDTTTSDRSTSTSGGAGGAGGGMFDFPTHFSIDDYNFGGGTGGKTTTTTTTTTRERERERERENKENTTRGETKKDAFNIDFGNFRTTEVEDINNGGDKLHILHNVFSSDTLGEIDRHMALFLGKIDGTNTKLTAMNDNETKFDNVGEFEKEFNECLAVGKKYSKKLELVSKIISKFKAMENTIQEVHKWLNTVLETSEEKFETSKKFQQVMLLYQKKKQEFRAVNGKIAVYLEEFELCEIDGLEVDKKKKEEFQFLQKRKESIRNGLKEIKSSIGKFKGFDIYKKEKKLTRVERKRTKENFESCFICPITQDLFEDPVILVETGSTYSRKAITQWLKTKNTDPLTNKVVRNKTLIPNISLRGATEEWKMKNQVVGSEVPKEKLTLENMKQ